MVPEYGRHCRHPFRHHYILERLAPLTKRHQGHIVESFVGKLIVVKEVVALVTCHL